MTEANKNHAIGSSAAPLSTPPEVGAPTRPPQEANTTTPPIIAPSPTSITMAPPTGLTLARDPAASTSHALWAITPNPQNAAINPYRYGMPFDHTPITNERGARQEESVVPTGQPTQSQEPAMSDLEDMLRTFLGRISESRRQSAHEEQPTEPTQQLRRNLFIEVPPRPSLESASRRSPGDHRAQPETARHQHSPSYQHHHPGPLQPQRAAGNRHPSFEPAQNDVGGAFPNDFASPSQQRQQANLQTMDVNTPPARTPYDLERDRELAAMKDQIREMTSQVHQAIRAAPEVDRVLRETLSTPFTTAITNYPLRNIGKMTIPIYEGTTDPSQHLQTFTIAMGRARFTPEERDAGYCQLFVENLRGEALRWFTRLGTNTISNFHQLSTAFLQHYLMFMQKEVSTADLWAMTQGPKESLRKFIEKFKQIASKITIPDDAGIMALQRALLYAPAYRRDLYVNKPQTLEDALHRAATFIELEEEEARVAIRIQAANPTAKPSPTKDKAIDTYNEPRQHIGRDYTGNRPPNVRRPPTAFAVNDRSPTKPAWNKYVRDGAKAGESFCDYHKIPGHATHECRSLQQLLLQKFQRGEIDDLNEETRPDDGAQQILANHDRQPEPRQNDNNNAQRKRTRETDEDNRPPRPKKLIN